jgi:hypothetical protein
MLRSKVVGLVLLIEGVLEEFQETVIDTKLESLTSHGTLHGLDSLL